MLPTDADDEWVTLPADLLLDGYDDKISFITGYPSSWDYLVGVLMTDDGQAYLMNNRYRY